MTQPRTVLVTGATGNQGGTLARHLLSRGHRVRALTRRPRSATAAHLAGLGAQVVPGDFDDPATLIAAARGAEVVFAMGTPFQHGPDAEIRQASAIITAAAEAGVGHLVYTSAASADRGTAVPHFDSKYIVEQRVVASGLPYTIVAPVGFFEVLIMSWNLTTLVNGQIRQTVPPQRTQQYVALADIAAFVTNIVEAPDKYTGLRIELASQQLTGPQLAEGLSPYVGRPVSYQAQPLDQVRQLYGEDMGKMLEFFATTGFNVDIPVLHHAHPDLPWHNLQSWAATVNWPALLNTANDHAGRL